MNGAGEVDEADGAVTVLVARRVVPGKEVEFEEWASELTRAASSFAGFLGAGLLRPGHVGELCHVVYRFA
jgi:antibiotic biosynthesis monooxygenase (ABM) superfamily enzyme